MLALTKCFQEIGLIDLFACIVLVPPSTKTGVQVAIALAALHNFDFAVVLQNPGTSDVVIRCTGHVNLAIDNIWTMAAHCLNCFCQ